MPSQHVMLWRRRALRASFGAATSGCVVLGLAACTDTPPVAPRPASPHSTYLASAITCLYKRGAVTLFCAEYAHASARTLAGALSVLRGHPAPVFGPLGAPKPTGTQRTPTGTRDVYFGQQGIDVFVATDTATFPADTIFSVPASIQNLSTEPLGTADGRTPSSDSIIVFFSQLPVVTAGIGTVNVYDPTGYNTFTAANQPYYQYPGLLPSNATSPTVNWQFAFQAGVQGFDFAVYVAAQVPDTSAAALAIPAHAFDSLAVGEAHTCAIRPGNHEYCWGFNAYGALGIQESSPVVIPEGVLGNLDMESIAAGAEFSCGLATTGAFCWGDNLSGEIGDGTTTDRGEPAMTLPPTGAFGAIAAGTDFSCGLVSGAAYCWGDNYAGQLGNGTTTSHASPTAVAGTYQFAAITVGAFHACGLTGDGSAFCWGANTDGELGTGSTDTLPTTAPTPVSTSTHFATLVAGANFTCGLDINGNAYCWGTNSFGQLGIGTAGGNASTPQQVSGGYQFTRLTAGAYHACGILTSNGTAYCWGSNSTGQLGNNSTNDEPAPTQVISTYAFTDIGAGFGHTCALVTGGGTYCWGDNSSGQIGDGTFTQRLSPTAVSLP
jgi:alpha-tubulin suppressor-like RCC1 family protein